MRILVFTGTPPGPSADRQADAHLGLGSYQLARGRRTAGASFEGSARDPSRESGVPFTMVMAPNGRVIYQRAGEVDLLKLRRAILARLPDAGCFAGNVEYGRQ